MIEPNDRNPTVTHLRFNAEELVRAMELIPLSKCLAGG